MKSKKLKLSEETFKDYLMELYVDENGDKKSTRCVWSDLGFMEYTGMYKVNKYTGFKEMVSEGTISYYNKKLNLTEKNIFDYHKIITKRIGEDVDYLEWSRKSNKNHKKESMLNQKTKKNKLIKYFGLDESYRHYSYNKLETLLERIVGSRELSKFYHELGGEVNGG